MKIKLSLSEKIFNCINAVVMILVTIVCLYPLLYILFASISDPTLLMKHRGILLKPLDFSIEAYKLVVKNPMIPIGYVNTLFYVLAGTAVNLVMTMLGAYGLSRKGFLLRNAIMMMIVFTMFFSGGLIPSFLLVKSLHLYNTRWSIIIPGAISAWNLIIMRTYFQSIPDSLEESAKIDGANDFMILFRIIIPLSTPIIAVMVLFYGVGHWNSYFDALVYIRDRQLYPLQIVLREILIVNQLNDMMNPSVNDAGTLAIAETIKYATIIVATVPILCIYPFLQKYFVKGVMIGAIKG